MNWNINAVFFYMHNSNTRCCFLKQTDKWSLFVAVFPLSSHTHTSIFLLQSVLDDIEYIIRKYVILPKFCQCSCISFVQFAVILSRPVCKILIRMKQSKDEMLIVTGISILTYLVTRKRMKTMQISSLTTSMLAIIMPFQLWEKVFMQPIKPYFNKEDLWVSSLIADL